MDQMNSYGSLSLGSRLRRLSDRLIQDVVEIYEAQGIDLHPTYFPLFNLLHQQGAVSVTEAAQQLGVSHPAISKIARKMIADELIVRSPDPTDERRFTLQPTAKSEQLLQSIQPIWEAIRSYLDQQVARQQYPILAALSEFETIIDRDGFVEPVLERLEVHERSHRVEIIGWDAAYREQFCQLNMAWLDRYFEGELTAQDREALSSPESYYLARGGYIWFARITDAKGEQKIVGCVALARHDERLFEVSKMGVDDQFQGYGVGRKLMLAALDKAREMSATEVYLESATKLTRAIRLYRNLGFIEVPHPQGESLYPRSDIYMTLTL